MSYHFDYDPSEGETTEEDLYGMKTGRKCSDCGTELRNHKDKDKPKDDFCPCCGVGC